MKKKLFLAFVLAMVLAVTASAQKLEDTERIADEFAKVDVSQYQGQFGFARLLPDGSRSYTQGDFTLALDGTIPYLLLDGEEIVAWGEEPEKSLKLAGAGSVTNFWLQLNGWDGQKGKYVTYGFFSDILLLPKELITVEIKLSSRQAFVPFDASGYNPASLELRIGESRFGYDATRGGFDVWYNPATAGEYSIVNTMNGEEVVGLGSIGEGVEDGNIVNLTKEGGVRDLFPVGMDSANWQNQWPMGLVSDGVWVPAQIYVARAYGSAMDIEVSGAVSRVEVYSLDSGERVLVSELDIPTPVSVGKGGGPINQLNVPSGYDHLVVEVIGADDWGPFNLWAYRAQQGGLGKG